MKNAFGGAGSARTEPCKTACTNHDMASSALSEDSDCLAKTMDQAAPYVSSPSAGVKSDCARRVARATSRSSNPAAMPHREDRDLQKQAFLSAYREGQVAFGHDRERPQWTPERRRLINASALPALMKTLFKPATNFPGRSVRTSSTASSSGAVVGILAWSYLKKSTIADPARVREAPTGFLDAIDDVDRLFCNMDRTLRNPNILVSASGLVAIDFDACLFMRRVAEVIAPRRFPLPGGHLLEGRRRTAPPGKVRPELAEKCISTAPDEWIAA